MFAGMFKALGIYKLYDNNVKKLKIKARAKDSLRSHRNVSQESRGRPQILR